MNRKLAGLVCAVASAYAGADEVQGLDTVRIQGQKETTSAATRLGLTIRETPASIEVIDADTMARRGDTTVIRAVTKAAGIIGGSSGHGTTGNYSVRGFTGYPGIDFLHDGIKLNGTIFSKRALDVASLDRIEIIRGAASVLNGEGSVGATVNLVSKKPSLSNEETALGLRAGSHDSYRVNLGLARVALDDRVAYRIDAVSRRTGSDFEREKRALDSLSAAVLYKVSDQLQTSLFIEKSEDDGDHDYQGTPLVNGKLDKRVRGINYNNLSDGIDAGSSLWIKHLVEWRPSHALEVKNQLYYQNADAQNRRLYLAVQDAANPELVNRRGYDSSQKQILLGNRLDMTVRGRLGGLENRFLLGLDVSTLALDREQSTYAGRILSTSLYSPARMAYRDFFTGAGDDYRKPDVTIALDQIALYAEDRLSITDRLHVVGGLRYDHVDLHYDFQKGLSSPVEQRIDKTHNKLSYRAGVVYELSESANLYASYSSSFEPGDASASFLTVSAAQTALDLTKARQFEIGLKQSFWDGKGDLAASAYVINKKDMLVSNPTPGAGVLNVGEQTAKGIEFSAGLSATDRLHIDANLALVDSEYDEFVHNGVDYSGRTPSSVPRHVANLGIRYTPLAGLGLGAWVRNVGAIHTDNIGFANSVRLPSHTTVDLTLDYAIGKHATVSILLKNLTDEMVATTARRDAQVFLGEARAVEFGVNYRF